MSWKKLKYNTYSYSAYNGLVRILVVKKVGMLANLKVREKRKGNGTCLVNAAIRKAERLKLKRLIIIIVTETKEAKAFWKKWNIVRKGCIEIS